MHMKTFQERAAATAVYPRSDTEPMIGIMYAALGLAGEGGEVADEVKKAWRNDQTITQARMERIVDELGDVLWYVSTCCDELGINLEDVAKDNLHKLHQRQTKGELKQR